MSVDDFVSALKCGGVLDHNCNHDKTEPHLVEGLVHCLNPQCDLILNLVDEGTG